MRKKDEIFKAVLEFKKKYPITFAFRTKEHSKILEKHLNPDEKVKYVFAGQKNNTSFEIPNSFVIAITNERIILGRKRLLFGYFFYSITPDLFNDIKVESNILWGKIIIDTVKELVVISNISRNALEEIETNFTENIIEWKKEYGANKPKM